MKILKEPLFQFLLIGLVIFVGYSIVNPGNWSGENKIIVDRGRIQSLTEGFSSIWNRPPTDSELKNLVDEFIVEEIYYRRALKMGLDKNDTVIRRRLRQKMEFIAVNEEKVPAPTDEELLEYISNKPEKFSSDAVYSFEQFYIRTDNPAQVSIEEQIQSLKEKLQAGEHVSVGASLFPRIFEAITAFNIDRTFGQGFADSMDSLPLNTWSGPLRSGYGLHLIKLTERRPGQILPLHEVRSEAEREWLYEKKQKLEDSYRQDLIGQYEIIIQWPGNSDEE